MHCCAGAVSRVSITVYDYAEHIGEALAWTSPSKGSSPSEKGLSMKSDPLGGQLLYTHLKQAAMFGGDSNSRWYTPPPHSCPEVIALPHRAYIPAAHPGCTDKAPACRSHRVHKLRREVAGKVPHVA